MSDQVTVSLAWQRKLKTLSETVWAGKVDLPMITRWLGNFRGEVGTVEEERYHALHLLQSFMYFGINEIRELVHVFYRDVFRYPIVQKLRIERSLTTDSELIEEEFRKLLKENTRFIGAGRPSESGTHLLYYVRQENDLEVELFCNVEHLFHFESGKPPMLRDPSINRFVFFDDFCGSGEQVEDYLKSIALEIRAQTQGKNVEICYYPLFGTSWGLDEVRKLNAFTDVKAVVEFDDSYRAFSTESMHFKEAAAQFVDRDFSKKLFRHYGSKLWPAHPLGYRNGEMLVAFFHNTPDNVVPAFWCEAEAPSWRPVFNRYRKLSF